MSMRLLPWMEDVRALLRLGLPLAFTQIAQMAIMTTDVLVVGQLGSDALAAAALGVTLYYFCWVLGFGPMAAVAPVVAQALGASPGDRATPRVAIRMGLWASVIVSLPLALPLIFGEAILVALNQPADLASMAAPYMHALLPGLVFSLSFGALRVFASAVHAPRAALVILIMTIAVNLFCNIAFVFGRFGAPELGIIGSGVATTLANIFSFAALLIWTVWSKKTAKFRILKGFLTPDWRRFAELFRIGLPIGATMLFEGTLFQAGVLIVGQFGGQMLAAHQVAVNVASFTFMVPLGLAMAGTVRVGLAAGARDEAGMRRAGLTVMAVAAAVSFISATAMVLWPRAIAALYLDESDPANAPVIETAAGFLLLAAAFQLFDAVQVAGAMALRGLKDTQVPMILAGLSYWAIGMPVALWLTFEAGLGATGVWWGFVAGLAAAAVAMAWRFYRLTHQGGM
ncbi:MAG: MATE family efflux transporter [Alphaproteobacteria bacterium]|nr:MATE family efflux transporter [Alphaproteobacteria bacterium]